MNTIVNKNTRILLVLCLGILTTNAGATVGPNWIEQWGITWTFDKNISTDGNGDTYQYGTFVNGDYWIMGPANIISITPTPTSSSNGSMIDPVVGNKQGYDSRISWYDVTYNVGVGISTQSPLTVPAESSLISSANNSSTAYLRTVSILTVLPANAFDSLPAGVYPEQCFRPPYAGTDKSINHTENDLDYSKLSSLSRAGITNIPTLVQTSDTPVQSSSVERMFERAWIDHLAGFNSRAMHPAENMPDYGRDMAVQIGQAAMMLNLDYSDQAKNKLLIRFIQLGIDLYGIAAGVSQIPYETWGPDGGHQMGRKLPILFAGVILNDSGMKDIGQTNVVFHEDQMTWYINEEDVERELRVTQCRGYSLGASVNTISVYHPEQYTYLDDCYIEITAGRGSGQRRHITNSTVPRLGGNGVLTVSPSWTTIPDSTSYYQLKGYETHHLGMPEWSISTGGISDRDNPSWFADYRPLNGYAWPGFILAAHIMNLKPLWNHDALFDYQDRYYRNTAPGGDYYGTPDFINSFTKSMWNTYRGNYGPIWPDTGPVDTTPPLPPTNLNSNQQTSSSIQLAWTAPAIAADGDTASVYRILRNGSLVNTVSATSYLDSSLSANTQYSYQIYSVDDAGNLSESAASGTFSTTSAPSDQNTFYISPDGSSSNTGANWNNALRNLPNPLIRGETYYLAGGSYNAFTFSTPAGTDLITIKKATEQNHGTDTGWNTSYAATPAVIPGIEIQDSSYLLLDGQEEDGIHVVWEGTPSSGGSVLRIADSQYITVRYCDLDGNYQESGGSQTAGSCSVLSLNTTSFVTVTHCKLHDAADDGAEIHHCNNLIFNYNEVYNMHGCGTDGGCGPCYNGHSDGLELYYVNNGEFIGNYIHNIPSTSTFFLLGGTAHSNDLLLANNIFYNNADTGFIAYLQAVDGVRLYNNVFWGQAAGRYGGLSIGDNLTDLDMYNNIILSVNYSHMGATYNAAEHRGDYNVFGFDTNEYPEQTHDQILSDPGFEMINGAGGPLIADAVKEDFMLESDSTCINTGTVVSNAYDILGTSRPQDGIFDVGAFEQSSTTTPGTYTLNISADNGAVTKSPDRAEYNAGETVTLTAVPNAGYTFSGWSGDASGTANPATILMNSDKSVTADFELIPSTPPTDTVYQNIEEMTFDGTPGSSQTVPTTGWNASGTTITLWANPSALTGNQYILGHTIGTWSNRIQVYLNDTSLNLGLGNTHFLQTDLAILQTGQWYFISLSWNGTNYTVRVNDQIAGSGIYSGLTTLETFADLGNNGNTDSRTEPFFGVIDDVRIYGRSLSNAETAALYQYGRTTSTPPATYSLNTSTINGVILKNPNKTSYTAGETVTLTAVPDSGYSFANWSGDAAGSTNPVMITMDSNKSVTANFLEDTQSSPASELEAYWKLTENQGEEVFDSSNNGHIATLINDPDWAGEEGLLFDGNDYLQVPDSNSLELTRSMTLSAWVKLTDITSYAKVLIKPHLEPVVPWEMYTIDLGNSGDSPRFVVTDGMVDGSSATASDAGTVLDLEQWYHITGTYDGTSSSLYLDGTLIDSQTVNFQVGTNSMPLCIGGRLGSNTLNGYLSDVRIYTGAMSAAKIQGLYIAGRNDRLVRLLFDDIRYQPEHTYDVSGKNIVGTQIDNPSGGLAAPDEYVEFTKTTQAIEIPTQEMNPNQGTVALWTTPANNTGIQFIFGHTFLNANWILLYSVNGQLACGLGDTTVLQSSIAQLPVGQMAHLVLTWDHGSYAVYMDGEELVTGSYSGLTELAPTADIGNIGDPSTRTYCYQGIIEDVRTYARALSADEVSYLCYQTQEIKEGLSRALTFQVEGIDEQGNPITYTQQDIQNLPANATFDEATQTLIFRPRYDQAGEYTVIFNKEGQDPQTITIIVDDEQLQEWYQDFLSDQQLIGSSGV